MDSTILAETYASTLGDAEVRQRWLDDQMERHRIEEEEAAKAKVEFYLSNARDAQAYVQILKKVMGEKRLTAKGRVVVLENVRSWATTYGEIVESGLLEDSDRWERFFILPLKATGGTRFTGRELLDSAGEALCILGKDDIYIREGH